MKKLVLIRGPICAGKTTTVNLIKERLDEVSVIDVDAFKRAIDYTHASEWRDRLAFDTALFLADNLMKLNRTIIADIHSNKRYQYDKYKELAEKNDYYLYSYLLYPSLDVCLKRNRSREIPDVLYKITDKEIEEYWINPYLVDDESMINSSNKNPCQIAEFILKDIRKV
jgi:predicted kinase